MSYTVGEVSAMLGLTPAQVRSFASGFMAPETGERSALRFGFQDLIILRTASELTAANIPLRKVKRVLELLRDQLPDRRALTGVRITADGDRVVVRDGAAVWNPESGQSLFDFAVADIAQKTTPFLMRAAADARERADELSAEEWYALACELEVTSIEEARHAYESAIRADSSHADAHVNLGRLLHQDGAASDAERHYRAALEGDPHHETAAFNLGVALEDLERFDDAARAYEQAIALDPENADAHYNLAGILEKRGDKQAALRHLKVYRVLHQGGRAEP